MTLGSSALVIGSPRFDKGTFRIPLLASSKDVQIDLVNDKHVGCALVSAEWNGTFNAKAGGV